MKKSIDIRSFFKIRESSVTHDNEKTKNITKPSPVSSAQLEASTSISEENPPKNEEGSTLPTTSGQRTDSDLEQRVATFESSVSAGNEKRNNLGTLQTGPLQPHINFPKTKIGNYSRSFTSRYYDLYSWLEYNTEEDKVYCFVCRHFIKEGIRDQREKFVKNGYNNWKKLGEGLKKHAESSIHAECAQKYVAYKESLKTGDVLQQVLHQQEQDVIHNREYLLKLIDIILTLVRQGLPLRGHQEDTSSKNRGNFLEITQLFSKYDKNFCVHFEKHFNYCSPDIQNEIIEITACLTRERIVEEAKACGFFSLSVDEARCYKDEQLSITIRYVIDLNVVERFIGFIDCSTSRDAQGLARLILTTLNKNQLDDVPILAQSYDGASVMSGKNKGLQAIIKETHPHAVYIHCLAHKLNLVVVDSCANVPSVKTFFNGMESLYIHFSQPGRHANLKKMKESLGIKISCEMGSLSTTRWSCRFENCKALLTTYEAIKLALDEEVAENRDKYAIEALGLLTTMQKPEFIISLHIFHSVLATVNVLSKFFQTKNATLFQASDLIASTIHTFDASRNEFEIWKDIELFAGKHGISLEPVRLSKRRRQQMDFYTETTVGKSDTLDLPNDTQTEDYWKINIYNQVMDNIIVNFKRRFENLPLANAVDSFLKLDMGNANNFINNYKDILKIDSAALNAEAIVMKNMFHLKNCEINIENLKKHIKKEFCPNVYKLLQAALALPVSSASCERSFSAMRRIKTWLRTTMLQNRFSHMSLLHIENEIVKNTITSEAVLNRFSEKHRKLKLN